MDFPDEIIPTEAVAAIIYALTRRGRLTTTDAGEIAGYAHSRSARHMLNKIASVPVYKPERGVWALNDEVTQIAELVAPLVDKLRRENLPAAGAYDLYAMPVKAAELRALLDAFDALARRQCTTTMHSAG